MKMRLKQLLNLSLVLFASSVAGCGGSGVVEPTDEQDVFASVEGLGDAAGDDEVFAMAFASGSVPENRDDYGQRGYQVTGEPTYDGDEVTVPVKISGGVHATSKLESRRSQASTVAETEQTWTLQRVDGEWKIKDAPLG